MRLVSRILRIRSLIASGVVGLFFLRSLGRTLFLHTPDGLGRSELAAQLARVGSQAEGTARNWATVTRLMDMLGPPA